MTVFRVEKTKDFTVMSNHHLRNKTLSLKAKRLLSLMLSLPEDLSINLSALGTDYKAGGIKSNLTEGSRILYRHDGRDFKDDGKRTDSITADCRSSPVSGLRTGEDISPDGKTGDKREGLCAVNERCSLHCTVMDRWSFTAIWYCNAPYADL